MSERTWEDWEHPGDSVWPVAIIEDRYSGVYSGGAWVAVAAFDSRCREGAIHEGVLGGDCECRDFWDKASGLAWIAVGATPNDALAALNAKMGPYLRSAVVPPMREAEPK